MKILIASDTYYPHTNGASYFTQRLAHYLALRGHSVAVVCPSEDTRNTLATIHGIPLYGVPSLPIFFYHGFRFAMPGLSRAYIRKAISEHQPDVIHIQNHFIIGRALVKEAQRSGIPVVATNHFMPENLTHYLHLPKAITRQINNFLWWDFVRIFRHALIVTTPTQTALSLIASRLPFPVEALSCGIDTKHFSPRQEADTDRAFLIAHYGIPSSHVLFYMGRLDREKNLDFVIRSLAQTAADSHVHLVIGGTGAEQNRLESLTKRLGLSERVHFLGFIPDKHLPTLYRSVDAFIIAGSAELQSIVTMEAMASGLPVLALNAIALPELVQDGENGFLFDLKDPVKLAGIIDRIFADDALRQRLGAMSRERIMRHDIEKTISTFEGIYQRAIVTCAKRI